MVKQNYGTRTRGVNRSSSELQMKLDDYMNSFQSRNKLRAETRNQNTEQMADRQTLNILYSDQSLYTREDRMQREIIKTDFCC